MVNMLIPGNALYSGIANDAVVFTMRHQLLDAERWKKFVEVYRADSDDRDNGWRNEYWGKMMRGAVLTYMYNNDEKLYAVLRDAVVGLLDAAREDGRISTYGDANQYHGWDMWGRKYVLTGLLHFRRICKDAALSDRILKAACAHADSVLAHVGEGKLNITGTSSNWGGVNSCSIMEPMLDLYKTTNEERYLRFAEYIISTGGCSDGNLIEKALENTLKPYEYPEVKAYETMSFFEGLLAYYEITGDKKYMTAVDNFVEAVNETDITLIGCSGCTHELFDHSGVKQTEPSDGIMQETCVTVTWMRLMARLFQLTGKRKYLDRIEQSAYNALYGAMNTGNLKQLSREEKVWMSPLPFDSYSPLYNNQRGIGIGGFKKFVSGGYYGCCACIASAGIALVPLTAVMETENGAVINLYMPGKASTSTGLTLSIKTEMPAAFRNCVEVLSAPASAQEIRFRVPDYAIAPEMRINDEACNAEVSDGYMTVKRTWQAGDVITLNADMKLEEILLNGRTAFRYGYIVLTRDSAKEIEDVDLAESIALARTAGQVNMEIQKPLKGEQLRLSLARQDGKELLLTDYAGCGKDWLGKRNRITVWMNIK